MAAHLVRATDENEVSRVGHGKASGEGAPFRPWRKSRQPALGCPERQGLRQPPFAACIPRAVLVGLLVWRRRGATQPGSSRGAGVVVPALLFLVVLIVVALVVLMAGQWSAQHGRGTMLHEAPAAQAPSAATGPALPPPESRPPRRRRPLPPSGPREPRRPRPQLGSDAVALPEPGEPRPPTPAISRKRLPRTSTQNAA